MRMPEPLPDGGSIGFVAPSFGCATEPYTSMFNAALRRFSAMGYKLKLGPNCYAGQGIGISNAPRLCAQELTDMYVNGGADAILACGGGELMCETIGYVDFDAIAAAEPRLYMGYSDNTNFTFLSATLADTAAIYGPCAPTFGYNNWPDSVGDAFTLLTGKKRSFRGYPMWTLPDRDEAGAKDEPAEPSLEPPECNMPTVYRAWPDKPIDMQGRLLGGCLDILVTLAGTRFDKVAVFNDRYADDGVIWFLESCDLNVFAMRRAVWQLKQAGWFDKTRGFIIGRPLHYGEEMMGLDQYAAVLEPLKEFGAPVIMDADLGHLPPMMPLMTGAMARVALDEGGLSVDYLE